ncbi:MAG: hypothetical protein HQK97_07575 [Nitrospirae bacterium]|nr:hypothetical protein [Nitrospirota bacterium]
MKKILFLTVITAISMAIFLPLSHADMFVLYNDNKTGDGVPVSLNMLQYGEFKTWSCDVDISDNTTTAVSVAINGNQCTRFCSTTSMNKFSPMAMALYSLSTAELAAGMASFRFVDTPVQRIRASLITLTGGTNPQVTIRCTGVR